jgi:hypothetical protein
MRTFILCFVALNVAACGTNFPHNEGDPADVANVVMKIKEDLGVYQDYDAGEAGAKPLDNVCGGAVGFTIDSVKVSLTTQTDISQSGSASATLPVGPATFGPSASVSQEGRGTQTLTFTLYPKAQPASNKRTEINAGTHPIAASLKSLREGLLKASQSRPCVSLIPPPDPATGKVADPGGTYAFGFTVINQLSRGGTLKFLVFSLGASNSAQRQAGNTITVTFKARPGSAAALIN